MITGIRAILFASVQFAAGRLDKANGRKEFFRADIAEIEFVIRENYDAVVEVARDAPAEQYRESLRLAMQISLATPVLQKTWGVDSDGLEVHKTNRCCLRKTVN
jgi:hypothetical protein